MFLSISETSTKVIYKASTGGLVGVIYLAADPLLPLSLEAKPEL